MANENEWIKEETANNLIKLVETDTNVVIRQVFVLILIVILTPKRFI